MPQNNFPVHALHYAIVMTGLLREGGGQLTLALDAHEHMVKLGMAQTQSSQEASLRTLGTSELSKTAKHGTGNATLRLQVVEEAVDKMVAAAKDSSITDSPGTPDCSIPAASMLRLNLTMDSYYPSIRLEERTRLARG
jgi:pentatricopeptide repeat-containing protein PET309